MEGKLAKPSSEATIIRMLEELQTMLVEHRSVIESFSTRLERIEQKLDALNEKASRILGAGGERAEDRSPLPGGSTRTH
jgi:hypothetical protein